MEILIFNDDKTLAEIFSVYAPDFEGIDFFQYSFSVRLDNALHRHFKGQDRLPISQLLELTQLDLYAIKNLGKKSIKELYEFLEDFFDHEALKQDTARLNDEKKAEMQIRAGKIIEYISASINSPEKVDTTNLSDDVVDLIQQGLESEEIKNNDVTTELLSNFDYYCNVVSSLGEYSAAIEFSKQCYDEIPKKQKKEYAQYNIKSFVKMYLSGNNKYNNIIELIPDNAVFAETEYVIELLCAYGIKKSAFAIEYRLFINWLSFDMETLIKNTLQEKEFTVLKYRNCENKTLDEIGKILDVTRERVRQHESKATRKLCIALSKHDFISIIYLRLNRKKFIHYEDLCTVIPSETAGILWGLCKRNELDFRGHCYHSGYDAIIFEDDFEKGIDYAYSLIEDLPFIVENNEMKELIANAVINLGLSEEEIRLAIKDKLIQYPGAYSKHKLTKKDMCDYLIYTDFSTGYRKNKEADFIKFNSRIRTLFGEKYADSSQRGLGGIIERFCINLGNATYIHPDLYSEEKRYDYINSFNRDISYSAADIYDEDENIIKEINLSEEIPDLTNTTPISISIQNFVIDVKNWTDLFVASANYLYEKFDTALPDELWSSGGKKLLLSTSSEGMDRPRSISNGHYVDAIFWSSILPIKEIIRLLNYCGIDNSDVSIICIIEEEKTFNSIDSTDYIEEIDEEEINEEDAFSVIEDIASDEPIDYQEKDAESELINPSAYHKLESVAFIYDNPGGLSLETISSFLGDECPKEDLIAILNNISFAARTADGNYTFNKAEIEEIRASYVPCKQNKSVDKEKYIEVLKTVFFYSGVALDAIGLDTFREEYSNMFNEAIDCDDDMLIKRLKCCGIINMDRVFLPESIIPDDVKEKLFAYIKSNFESGKNLIYYKSILLDLADDFVYCYSLTDETVLRSFIKATMKAGEFFLAAKYIAVDESVKPDIKAELDNYLLSVGKPVVYEEIYSNLSHFPKKEIGEFIRLTDDYICNKNGEYFHKDIFNCTEDELCKIIEIINGYINENDYAIWSVVFEDLTEHIPSLMKNNPYITRMGLRNVFTPVLNTFFNINEEVFCTKSESLTMKDVIRNYCVKNAPFTDNELNDFIKKNKTQYYNSVILSSTTRVSETLFLSKNAIKFDVDAIDAAIDSYITGDFIPVKDLDTFLSFPSVGYEWNSFMLTSYVINFSKKFKLLYNNIAIKTPAGAIVKNDCNINDFSDVCAIILSQSNSNLNNDEAIKCLYSLGLLATPKYSDVGKAITKMKEIKLRRGDA